MPTDHPVAPTPAASVEIVRAPASGTPGSGSGAALRPSVAAARDDREPLFRDRCGVDHRETTPPICYYGSRDPAAFTVALIGDSHAAHYWGTVDALARARGWRFVPMTKSSCQWADVRVYARHLGREYTECATWRANVRKALARIVPDLVIVSDDRWVLSLPEGSRSDRVIGEAMGRALETIAMYPTILLVDGAYFTTDVPGCLSSHLDEVSRCAKARSAVMYKRGVRERIAARYASVPLVDLTGAQCPRDPCPVVVDGMIVYRDDHHLTLTFARSLAPALGRALDRLGIVPAADDAPSSDPSFEPSPLATEPPDPPSPDPTASPSAAP